MAIQDSNVVDLVSTDSESGFVTLTVVDDLDWNDEAAHFLSLREKVNTYCNYIASGQLNGDYPSVKRMKPVVSLMLFHSPPVNALILFDQMRDLLAGEGCLFEWRMAQSEAVFGS
ncbi:MAG: DUF6572 domain-containing protein [Verrucomicrobiota bacterium]